MAGRLVSAILQSRYERLRAPIIYPHHMDLPKNIFEDITCLDNIKKAYVELVRKFDLDIKSGRYRGIDGVKMNSLDFVSENVLFEIQKEMKQLKKLSPAYMALIPKKNGKKRKIYVYPIRERIKAEAIYRMLLPFFDAYFSPFLFSYRSSHPSYYAARSAVRRYKRYYGENYVLVTDISDYADTIDHEIIMKKLSILKMDKRTLALLELFIKTDTFENGKRVARQRGLLTGTPLYALLSNFYMDDFDKWAGKAAAFYRRVGDDIIVMDKDAEKVRRVNEKLSETATSLKLKLNRDKSRLIKDTVEFTFLGYAFRNGKIGFDESSRKKAIAGWKKQICDSRAKRTSAKIKHMRQLSGIGANNLNNQFKQLIDKKKLVDDTVKIKEFSERFFHITTSYVKGRYSAKNRRIASRELQKAKVPSLFKKYVKMRYPKKHAASK
jgi:hypothetical protein